MSCGKSPRFTWRNQGRRLNVSYSVPWAISEAQPGTEPGLAKSQCYITLQARWLATTPPSTFRCMQMLRISTFHHPSVCVTISHISQGSRNLLINHAAHRSAGVKSCLLSQTSAFLGTDGCMHKDDKLMIKGYFWRRGPICNDIRKQRTRKHTPLTSTGKKIISW